MADQDVAESQPTEVMERAMSDGEHEHVMRRTAAADGRSRPPGAGAPRSSARVARNEHLGLLIALAILFTLLSVFVPFFLTERNLMNTLQSASFLGIVALAMTLVILAAEIDISVGSAMACTRHCWASCPGRWVGPSGWPWAFVLVLGTFIGMGAGWVRARFNVPSFIVTLALLSALRGAGLWMTNASPIAIPDQTFAVPRQRTRR